MYCKKILSHKNIVSHKFFCHKAYILKFWQKIVTFSPKYTLSHKYILWQINFFLTNKAWTSCIFFHYYLENDFYTNFWNQNFWKKFIVSVNFDKKGFEKKFEVQTYHSHYHELDRTAGVISSVGAQSEVPFRNIRAFDG